MHPYPFINEEMGYVKKIEIAPEREVPGTRVERGKESTTTTTGTS